LIPQRIERRSHPYQKCALPIKLRNLKYISSLKIKPIKRLTIKVKLLKILKKIKSIYDIML
jgi:hypothetical protein